MDKIKVSSEVAHALEVALKTCSKVKFFEQHSNKLQWGLDIYLPLNQISNWEMAQILINGYEVEETPEDKVINKYLIAKQGLTNSKGIGNKEYSRGIVNGIESTLDALNIKIKGINN